MQRRSFSALTDRVRAWWAGLVWEYRRRGEPSSLADQPVREPTADAVYIVGPSDPEPRVDRRRAPGASS